MRDPKIIAKLIALNVFRYKTEGVGPEMKQVRQHRMNYSQFMKLCGCSRSVPEDEIKRIGHELSELGFLLTRSAVNEFIFSEIVFVPGIVQLSCKRVQYLIDNSDEAIEFAFKNEYRSGTFSPRSLHKYEGDAA